MKEDTHDPERARINTTLNTLYIVGQLARICEQEMYRDKTPENTQYGTLYNHVDYIRHLMIWGGSIDTVIKTQMLLGDKDEEFLKDVKENKDLQGLINRFRQVL